MVTYCFIVGEEVVAAQTAQDGYEIVRPDDPAAPEGMVFAGWFYENGEPVFDGDEPVIAATDPQIPEISVFARFIDAPAEEEETPSDDTADASVGTPLGASADTAGDTEGESDTPADAPETTSDDTEKDTDTSVGTPLGASADTADDTEGESDTPADAPETTSDDTEKDTDASVGTPLGASADTADDTNADPADASLSEGGGAAAPEGVVPFDQSVVYNGVLITVKADAGAFPAGAALSVTRVLLYEQNQADAAVDEVRDDDQNVAARYTFDISILDENGNELQPAEGHSVEVSFALAEAGDENLEASVYHIDDDMTAEKLDTAATDEAVTAVTDGFSLYTVEFTYEKREYILPGDSSVALSEILDAVGLKGAAEAVSVSAPELFSAETDADGAWIVRANRAFTSTEWMRVTIGGIEYEITVTDSKWEEVTPALTYATVNITMKDGAQAALKHWRHTPIDGEVTEGTTWTGSSFSTGRFVFTFSKPMEIDQDGVEETKKSETEYEYAFTTTQEVQESACEVAVNIAARFTLTVDPAKDGIVEAYCGGVCADRPRGEDRRHPLRDA